MNTLKDQVEAFLFLEADIADRHDYAGWLALWAHDGCYWIPCNDDDADPEHHVAIIHETLSGLEDRVRRLLSGYAHTQSPQSRLARVVSNVRVAAISDGLVEVRSVFNITAFRRGVMDTYAARVVHHLRPKGESFLIVRKTVYLVNNDSFMSNMTFLI